MKSTEMYNEFDIYDEFGVILSLTEIRNNALSFNDCARFAIQFTNRV